MILSDKKQKKSLLASIFFLFIFAIVLYYIFYLSAASSTWTKFWSQRGGRRNTNCPPRVPTKYVSLPDWPDNIFILVQLSRMHYYHGGYYVCMPIHINSTLLHVAPAEHGQSFTWWELAFPFAHRPTTSRSNSTNEFATRLETARYRI